MFFGVGNLWHNYDIHKTFFSLTLGDMSFEDYYGRFRVNCEEIRMSDPISSDIAAMERQQKYMWVAHFLSSLISSFDGVQPQILGAKELPSLSEVFSHLHHATLPSVTPSPTNRFTLVASIGPLAPLDLISPWFWPWLAQSP